MKSRPFTTSFFTSCVFLISLAGGFNLLVDPYRMFSLLTLVGINEYKPALQSKVRLLKAYEVRRIKPDCVLIGTSRAHIGFSVNHPGWSHACTKPYNLAFDGATTKEMYAYLVHAHRTHPLSSALIALDTYHPSRAPSSTRADFEESILMTDTAHLANHWRAISADFRILTSIDTTVESLTTVFSQSDSEPSWYAETGQRLAEIYFRRAGEVFFDQGPREYFDQVNQREVGYKLGWRIPQKRDAGRRFYPTSFQQDSEPDSFGYIEKMVDFCRENNIQATFFFTPSHVYQRELDSLTGSWLAVEEGKRRMVALLANDGRKHNAPPYHLWDFSTYSEVTTEDPSMANSSEEMRFYWDSSHFKEIVGDWVISRVFNNNDPEIPENFGVRLGETNIENVLEGDQNAHLQYRREHPEVEGFFAVHISEFCEANGIDCSQIAEPEV